MNKQTAIPVMLLALIIVPLVYLAYSNGHTHHKIGGKEIVTDIRSTYTHGIPAQHRRLDP